MNVKKNICKRIFGGSLFFPKLTASVSRAVGTRATGGNFRNILNKVEGGIMLFFFLLSWGDLLPPPSQLKAVLKGGEEQKGNC
jgi:hypothetical protein